MTFGGRALSLTREFTARIDVLILHHENEKPYTGNPLSAADAASSEAQTQTGQCTEVNRYSRKKLSASEHSKRLISRMCRALVELPKNSGLDCISTDLRDLQIKCHAPKEGNRHISYEFYGTAPNICFGSQYSKREAIALLAAFLEGSYWLKPVYARQWIEIGKSAEVSVSCYAINNEVEAA